MLFRTLDSAAPSNDHPARDSSIVRVLLVADTHIGFDKPMRPRIQRRRRGDDFMANFHRALEPALRGEVDIVVHGGDLLFRSRVPPGLVEEAVAPLVRVADAGVPVFLVPGNHERSEIPRTLHTSHPNLHIFQEARTIPVVVGNAKLAVSGFPFVRRVDQAFDDELARTGWHHIEADVRLLCIHQSVEGAQVGPNDFTFRRGKDVIAGPSVPKGFAAVLSGHIHRSQILRHDLRRRPLAAPVIYPGSVERTSFAEKDEEKHYAVVEVRPTATGGELVRTSFVPLPARPMVTVELSGPDLESADRLVRRLTSELDGLPRDAVVRIRVVGDPPPAAAAALRAQGLRELVPSTANIAIVFVRPR